MRERTLRLRLLMMVVVLAGAAAEGSDAGGDKLGCKLAGARYFGAAAKKATVCFTLSADKTTMLEYSFDVCKQADVALSSSIVRKRVKLTSNGSFSNVSSALAAGENGLGFVNITFAGRVQGGLASGTLTLKAVDTGSTFKCAWSAHRSSG